MNILILIFRILNIFQKKQEKVLLGWK